MYHLKSINKKPKIIFAYPLYFLGTNSSTTANIAEYSPPTLTPVKNLQIANLIY